MDDPKSQTTELVTAERRSSAGRRMLVCRRDRGAYSRCELQRCRLAKIPSFRRCSCVIKAPTQGRHQTGGRKPTSLRPVAKGEFRGTYLAK